MSVKNRAASNTFDKSAALIKVSQELLPTTRSSLLCNSAEAFSSTNGWTNDLEKGNHWEAMQNNDPWSLTEELYRTSWRRSVEEHRVTVCALALDAVYTSRALWCDRIWVEHHLLIRITEPILTFNIPNGHLCFYWCTSVNLDRSARARREKTQSLLPVHCTVLKSHQKSLKWGWETSVHLSNSLHNTKGSSLSKWAVTSNQWAFVAIVKCFN